MGSRKIYKKIAVSFVASSFLAAGLWAGASLTLDVGVNNWTMFSVPSDNSTFISTHNASIAGIYSYSGSVWSSNLTNSITLSAGTGYLLKAGSSGLSVSTIYGTDEESATAFYARVKALSANTWHLIGIRTASGITVTDIVNNASSIINTSACSTSSETNVGTKILVAEGNQSTQFAWKSSSDNYTIPSGGAIFVYHGCYSSLPTYSPIINSPIYKSENSNAITLSVSNPNYYVAPTTTGTTATSTSGGTVTGGTLDETASTDTTSVVTSDVVSVDTTTTSQTISTVDDTAGTSEIKVELTDTTTGTSTGVQTEVKMSNSATVEIQTDGSVKATETAETGDTNAVTVSKTGDTAMESTTKDKVKIKANVPAGKEGAKVKTDAKSGKMTAETKLDSKDTNKEVKISVEVDPTNKSAKASISKEAFPTSVIEQISGGNANIVIVTGAPSEAGVLDSSTDVLLEDGTSRSLRATTTTKAIGVKTTFKSTRSFFASRKSTSRETDYSKAKTVEVIPTTSWQKFEEIVLFDGKRSLKLLLGSADIVIDGQRSVMTQNEAYILPLQIEVGGVAPTQTTEAIYSNGKLSLGSGWNLISLPVDTTVDDMSIFGSYSAIWAYNGETWSNPTTVTKGQGFWINMDNANEVAFSGDSYEPTVADLNSGWSLVGTGNDLTNFKSINSLEAVWTYQNGWISDPETIYTGQGFWMKK